MVNGIVGHKVRVAVRAVFANRVNQEILVRFLIEVGEKLGVVEDPDIRAVEGDDLPHVLETLTDFLAAALKGNVVAQEGARDMQLVEDRQADGGLGDDISEERGLPRPAIRRDEQHAALIEQPFD